MEIFIAFLKSVPDVIWAAIIASFLTLGGVIATNRGNYNRLIKQLSHDAIERDRERKMELRRTVYLEAAKAITIKHSIIGKLADLTIADSDLAKQISDSEISISKVNVIGSDQTVKAVSDLNSAIMKKYLELTAKRFPLVQRQAEINIQNNLYAESSKERDHMILLMKEFNLRGAEDERYWEVINNNYEFEKKQCDEYTNKINKLQAINEQEQIQLSLECLEAAKEISSFFVPAISSVRQEMDIPFDENAYRKTLEKSWQVSQDSVGKFIKKITGKSD